VTNLKDFSEKLFLSKNLMLRALQGKMRDRHNNRQATETLSGQWF
jgi:hypothetical protein